MGFNDRLPKGLTSKKGQKKFIEKNLRKFIERKYKFPDDEKYIKVYENTKDQCLLLGLITEEGINEIEKEMEEKYKK